MATVPVRLDSFRLESRVFCSIVEASDDVIVVDGRQDRKSEEDHPHGQGGADTQFNSLFTKNM
jgi:hypothetical protein